MTGIMTSKMMPGAGDPAAPRSGGFVHAIPHLQLYEVPYEHLDRFQLLELAKRLGRPIKVTVDRRTGKSNDPGKDKLVQHFVSLEGMGHVKRAAALDHMRAILTEAQEKRMQISASAEPEVLIPDVSEPNAELIKLANMADKDLRDYAKKLGVVVEKREKRDTLTPKILSALGIVV